MADEVQRDLGKHEAEIEQLKEQVAAMRQDLHAIREMFAELRGGKKAVGILVSAAATMGAVVSWVLSVILHKPDGVP